MAEFKLPEIGEGVVEGEIVEWHVSPGDTVEEDQALVSVLTDKATVEITASFQGKIVSLAGGEGDEIEVGAVMLVYEGGSEAAAPAAEEPKPEERAPRNSGEASVSETQKGGGALIQFPLPEIGEGVVEGEIVEWLVKEGDSVAQDQPILSVLTDKATVEITSPADGVIRKLIGGEGDTVDVGATILEMESVGDAPVAAISQPEPKQEETIKTAKAPEAVAKTVGTVDPGNNPSVSTFGTPLATPAVRKLAAEKGLDLHTVAGTGPNHRITREDVLNTLKGSSAPQAAKPAPAKAKPATPALEPGERETRKPLKGLRKAIHTSMTRSMDIIPHFTYVDEVEMDNLVAMRASLKEEAAEDGIKLTYLPFIAKAVVFALKKYPILNSSVDDDTHEMVYKHYYNLGIATATKDGLTVPVLKDADKKDIPTIAGEIAALSDRARNRRSTLDDISGGTFTITSLGRLGGLLSTPIINYPEVGILGIHNIQDRAVVRNGEIVIRKMMNIALSFDHRVVDGDVGAVFANEVKTYLENPGRLLLKMV